MNNEIDLGKKRLINMHLNIMYFSSLILYLIFELKKKYAVEKKKKN